MPNGKGKTLKPGGASLTPDEKKLQGEILLARRVSMNETERELAMVFGMSPSMVAKRLAEARDGDFLNLARNLISERMISKALTVLETKLNEGDYEAAKDVLYGLQVLQKGGKATIEHITSSTPTLDQIRKERAKAIEGQVVEVSAPQKLLEPPDDPEGSVSGS